jgi:hypothetical protein|tara:strand:- start:3002 stop:4849 length:1848 start_codon:yes stop_codon:yes gene_type:complete
MVEADFINNFDDDFNRFTRLKNYIFNGYFDKMRDDNDYYNGNYPNIGEIIPREYRESGMGATIPPTARNAVDNASDHILTTPKIFVPAKPTENDQQAEQNLAERKRQFLASFWHNVETDYGDPLATARKKLVKDGRMVLKKELRWDLIPDPPSDTASSGEKRKFRNRLKKLTQSQFLWKISILPNETVVHDIDNPTDPKYVYEFYEVYPDEARRRYPEHADMWMEDGLEKLEFVEMYTKPQGDSKGEHKMWVQGSLVFENMNPYCWETSVSTDDKKDYDGYIPYIIRDSGWGEITADNDPADRYVGILRYIHPVLQAEARQLTAVDIQLRYSTFAPVITRNVMDDNTPIEVGPGKRINLVDDQDIQFVKLPEVPLSAFQMMDKVHQYTSELSKLGTLGGQPQRGVESATEADLNVRNAAVKLQSCVASLRACIAIASRQVFQDIQYILESPITIAGSTRRQASEITIKPNELDDFYAVDVELHTSDRAQIEMRDMMVWSQLYRTYNGMLSAETAMENSGIENPQQELLKASVNTLFMSPQAQQVRTMMMLKGLQGQAAEVLRAFQQDLLQQQQGPAPQEQMSSTEEITMDEVATPTGMQENIAMDRQTNVVNEMR